MKYLNVYNNHNGRLGNQLYIILQCFLNNFKYLNICNINNTDILNISNYIYNNIDNINNSDIIYSDLDKAKYYQQINIDFTEDDLTRFITSTICKSTYYNNKQKIYNTILIQIRGTDYLSKQYRKVFYINRPVFLLRSLERVSGHFPFITDAIVMSDDLKYCKQEFNHIFTHYFKNIEYYQPQTPEEDLLYASLFKYRIITNSTFQYWSSYISSVLFNNKNIVYVPDYYCKQLAVPLYKHWIKIRAQ